ncbi:Eco57I restriction-modification methylase domain-containing protein [Microvirga terrae]|uniref:site-specific DNA-methyltransferase (adenine-specific) n=1 Tax=Microvirga terrae TaxID=2740529 RepID=A0ABY5RW26_9HYPH|nr:Eco57I restriction-modification methylase domain-containing protein [Microvirga terrae]UVF19987.1 Eco57I restriction-modification methylase domain-containing protein [Microvirga terrae]
MNVLSPRSFAEPSTDPVELADLVGSAYAEQVTADHRKDHGLYLTPPAVARFMGELVGTHLGTARILDPAAGGGILVCGAVEAMLSKDSRPDRIEVTAYEVDPALARELQQVLTSLAEWAGKRGVELTFEVRNKDFVLANADALEGLGGLFAPGPLRSYDVIISNPPYFKLNKQDPRAQAALSIVHGQPNIYGLFMAIGASLLRPAGDFIFITPRSFASGPYFRAFRERFFSVIRPEFMHVFGSRRDAFARDAVLQENVILHGVRDNNWSDGQVRISTSAGVSDLEERQVRTVTIPDVLDLTSRERVLRMPATQSDDDIMRLVDGWPGSLAAYKWKISTGPVVPFRAREFQSKEGGPEYVPLLWMNHVRPMQVTWPLARHKPEHIQNVPASQYILLPNLNYVLLRRFSAKEEKRRLVAAPYLAQNFDVPMIGLENHLNYIHKPGGSLSEDEVFGITALLNSSHLDTWFRAVNGNTQVSATEIRSMPLPPHDVIVALGRMARGVVDLAGIDELVEQVLRTTPEALCPS